MNIQLFRMIWERNQDLTFGEAQKVCEAADATIQKEAEAIRQKRRLSHITADVMADKFVTLLKETLGPDTYAQVIARNMTIEYEGCCASHDFCDANEVMDAAFKSLAGFSTCDTGGDGIGCMSEECTALWNEAWTLAKVKMNKGPNIFTGSNIFDEIFGGGKGLQ